ncbi:enhancer of mRNA-decapping protein 4 homolog Ge-1 isoform X2 [Oratosquilla oratoria]|uniref:enhancer of mRNA-decapping protein 4 homolog Ge-1 isoform X2 n=1 Tax=Oratosquilla oratoria TaxID=337810 RepID=UPI003F775768
MGVAQSGLKDTTMEESGFKEGSAPFQSLHKKHTIQNIVFDCSDEKLSSAVVGSEVSIVVKPTSHTYGSSAITTRNITNYPWDLQYLQGSLVAMHCSGEYIAYAIKAPQKSNGMVRIMNVKSGDRGLVKSIRGMVRDISFAHLNHRILLAITDQFGSLYVHEVVKAEKEGSLDASLLVEITSTVSKASDNHRVIWCSYIPDEQIVEEDNGEAAYLLALTHGCQGEIWNIQAIMSKHGSGAVVSRAQVSSGYQVMDQHKEAITDAAFSPDGTALATASLDGYVKFFQVYLANEDKSPRCIHEWKPHDGKELSSLFFLDNHKNPSQDVQFWKYAVTGAENNAELKVWSCESWDCYQVLRFHQVPHYAPSKPLTLKAAIDPTSSFIVLSDLDRRMMYVMEVSQEGSSEEGARVVSVSELAVQYPVISLAISDAQWRPYKRWKHDHNHDHTHSIHVGDDDDDDSDSMDMVEGVVLRCTLINTKSLQEATLRFQPAVPTGHSAQIASADLASTQDSIVLRDGLTDLSMSFSTSISEAEGGSSGEASNTGAPPPPPPPPDSLTPNTLATPPSQKTSMNLLTPESFSSPRRMEEENGDEEDDEVKKFSAMLEKLSTTSPGDPVSMSGLLSKSSASSGVSSGSSIGVSSASSILSTVVSGSSKSPPATVLPPPPPPPLSPHLRRKGPKEEPLATSEVNPTRLAASATSSPSLEVQQILHSDNGKSEEDDYPEDENDDEEVNEEIECTEEDEDEDESTVLHSPVQSTPPPPAPPPSQQPSSLPAQPHTLPPQPHTLTSQVQSIAPQSLNLSSQTPVLPPQPHNLSSPVTPVLNQQPHTLTSQAQPLPPQTHNLTSPAQVLPPQPHNLTSPVQQHSPHQTQPQQSLPHLTHIQYNPKPPSLESIPQPSSMAQTQSKTPPAITDAFASVKGLPIVNQLTTCSQLESDLKPINKVGSGSEGPDSAGSDSYPLKWPNSSSPGLQHMNEKQSENNLAEIRQPMAREATQVNGPELGATSADIAELKTLMKTCISMSQEQHKRTTSETQALTSKIDKALSQIGMLAKRVDDLQAAQNQVQAQLPHVVAVSLRSIVEATLRSELRSSLTPGVIKSLDPLRIQLSNEIANIVSNTQSHLSDSLTKMVQSRNFVDNVSGAVSSALGPTVQTSCREAYNKVVVPGFNTVALQIFSQINDTFSRGTKEYTQIVESEVGNRQQVILDNFSKATKSMNNVCESLTSHLTTLNDAVNKLTMQHSMQMESLSERIGTLVHEEVGKAVREQQASLEAVVARSRAHTPAPTLPHTNPKLAQQHVQQLISQGQFNTAFKQALSASDLSLVVFVCERINPHQVFNQLPCPLSQDVLLSLINQLSHDFSSYTDLKLKYLEEAVMNLDCDHPVTQEHMRSVLQGFQRQLSTFLSTNPSNKKVKLLLMAVNHLIAT